MAFALWWSLFIVVFMICGCNVNGGTISYSSLFRSYGLARPQGVIDLHTFPYCTQYNGSSSPVYQKPCQDMDGADAYSQVDSRDLTFATAEKDADFVKYVCANTTSCTWPWQRTDSSEYSYVASIEDFAFFFDHGVVASGKVVPPMSGVLVSQDGTVLASFDAKEMATVVIVSQLLTAANITLDQLTHSVGHRPNETLRSSGVVLFATIEYDLASSVPTFLMRCTVWRESFTHHEYTYAKGNSFASKERRQTHIRGINLRIVQNIVTN